MVNFCFALHAPCVQTLFSFLVILITYQPLKETGKRGRKEKEKKKKQGATKDKENVKLISIATLLN